MVEGRALPEVVVVRDEDDFIDEVALSCAYLSVG
jgi:hypothetical protein